jgi:hypothetical protein
MKPTDSQAVTFHSPAYSYMFPSSYEAILFTAMLIAITTTFLVTRSFWAAQPGAIRVGEEHSIRLKRTSLQC